MKGTLRARRIGVVMHAWLPVVAGSFVMIFVFEVRKTVLRFFGYGTDTTRTLFV
ncbi:MAG: hypothetical protein H7Y43_12940 [Akkermansiaceae bacterium]|nr:hypothetical protein [Verrucomicrobiales bacterium]